MDTAGLLTGINMGTTTVTASMEGVNSNTVAVNVTAAAITGLQIMPANVSLAKGKTQPLTAVATYSDNTIVDVTNSVIWSSDDTATATITPAGLLTTMTPGSTTVTAKKEGISSNTAAINVSAAVITALHITPKSVSIANGQTQQLAATATYSDGSTADVSGDVTWLLGDTTTATLTHTGLLTGEKVGNTTVIANMDELSSNTVTINVTAAIITALHITAEEISLAKGQTQQLTAIATYSDNTTADVSNDVTWFLPSDTTTTTVTPAGLLTGVAMGSTTVTAHKEGVTSNTIAVNVTAATITALQITPAQVSLPRGGTQQLIATATYSDNSTADLSNDVAWLLSDNDTATMTLTGLLTAEEVGHTTVTASMDGINSNIVTITVTQAFTGVEVNGFTFNIHAGFPSTGFMGAAFTLHTPSHASDYNWVSDADWATVNSEGIVSFISQGNASPVTITATPTAGGLPLTYTFTLNRWFTNHGIEPMSSWDDTAYWCASLRQRLPIRSDLTLGTESIPRPGGSYSDIIIRKMGALFSEWGDTAAYAGSQFVSNYYWTSEIYGDYKDSGLYMVSTYGWISVAGRNSPVHGLCRLSL